MRSAKVAAEVERLTVDEAKAILNSPEFAKLRAAHDEGRSVVVHIGGRRIQYEPDFPRHFPGMADFEENGLFMGPSAFTLPQEAASTVLHELYRLNTTVAGAGDGFHSEATGFEGPAPYDFVRRALKSGEFDR